MNRIRRIKEYTKFIALLFLLFHFGFLQSPVHAQKIFPTNHLEMVIEKYEMFVEETLMDWNAPGAAVAIVKKDSVYFIRGFGTREVGKPLKINIHTVFRLASVSKGFASVLTGLLVQKNILKWDESVKKFLPEFALRDSQATQHLTISHILSHTSGLPPHAYTNLLEDNVPYPTILKKLQTVKSIFPVGKRYGYQNVLYSLAGDVVESATGKTYEDLIAENIFKPLGMNSASLGKVAFLMSANRAKPHVRDGFEWAVTEVEEAYYAVPPSAGVNANISDMAKWLRAMMGGSPDVIPPEVIKKITTPYARTPQELRKYRWRDRLSDAHYGLGWRIYNYSGTKIVYHGGWVKGFRAEMGFIPDQKVGIVVLVNSESMMANSFLPTFFDLYLNIADDENIQSMN